MTTSSTFTKSDEIRAYEDPNNNKTIKRYQENAKGTYLSASLTDRMSSRL